MNLQVHESVAGLAIDTSICKLLEIAYCTVDQNGPDGKQRGLCWAATAVTMIRYRSGVYRELCPWQVADLPSIGYDQGARGISVTKALQYYLNKAEMDKYAPVHRFAIDFFEIQHNINNCFPIAMDCGRYSFLVRIDGHMVTIIGYDGRQLIYWNSATLQIEVAHYLDDKKYIYMKMAAFSFDSKVTN